jgi:hypothetical protein
MTCGVFCRMFDNRARRLYRIRKLAVIDAAPGDEVE